MLIHKTRQLALLAATLIFSTCGVSSKDNADGSVSSEISRWGKSEYTLEAFVINESNSPLDVIFLNNGPHAGGCDSKHRVVMRSESKSMKTFRETWHCEINQVFGVLIQHPKGPLSVSGNRAKIICTDEGCRLLDVK